MRHGADRRMRWRKDFKHASYYSNQGAISTRAFMVPIFNVHEIGIGCNLAIGILLVVHKSRREI